MKVITFALTHKIWETFSHGINHSFTPNLKASLMMINQIPSIVLLSIRTIEINEALTLDYNQLKTIGIDKNLSKVKTKEFLTPFQAVSHNQNTFIVNYRRTQFEHFQASLPKISKLQLLAGRKLIDDVIIFGESEKFVLKRDASGERGSERMISKDKIEANQFVGIYPGTRGLVPSWIPYNKFLFPIFRNLKRDNHGNEYHLCIHTLPDFSRLVKHCPDNNLIGMLYMSPEGPEILLFTRRAIQKNEVICLDYNDLNVSVSWGDSISFSSNNLQKNARQEVIILDDDKEESETLVEKADLSRGCLLSPSSNDLQTNARREVIILDDIEDSSALEKIKSNQENLPKVLQSAEEPDSMLVEKQVDKNLNPLFDLALACDSTLALQEEPITLSGEGKFDTNTDFHANKSFITVLRSHKRGFAESLSMEFEDLSSINTSPKTKVLDSEAIILNIPKEFKKAFSIYPEEQTEITVKKHIEFYYKNSLPNKKTTQIKGFKNYLKAMNSNGIPKILVAAKINDSELGIGIFAKENIRSNTFIGLYTGLFELIPLSTNENNEYAFDVLNDIKSEEEINDLNLKLNDCGYFLRTNAKEIGNFTRYINHSFDPNIEADLCIINGNIQVVLRALKPIQKGEQLLLNYGLEYWKKLKIEPQNLDANTYIFYPAQDKVESQRKRKKRRVISQQVQIKKIDISKLNEFLISNHLDRSQDPDNVLDKYIEKTANLTPRQIGARRLTKKSQKILETYSENLKKNQMPEILTLGRLPKSDKISVFLSPDSAPIPSKTLLGVWAGNYRVIKVSDKKNYDYRFSYDLFSYEDQGENYQLLVDAGTSGNYTKCIQHSSKPNVEAFLFFDG